MSTCEKHNCEYKYRDAGCGKTQEYCPECEQEQFEYIRTHFLTKPCLWKKGG